MEVASCSICASPLRSEIEKKDIPGKSTEAISWARKQGVNISKFSLAKHRANHLGRSDRELSDRGIEASEQKATLSPGDGSIIPKDTKGLSRMRSVSRKSASQTAHISEQKSQSAETDKLPVVDVNKSPVSIVSDALFLDTVRDMVYQKLLSGEMELKLESGFKAIEIKNKIAEESQNEKLLLEILNEIRSEELRK